MLLEVAREATAREEVAEGHRVVVGVEQTTGPPVELLHLDEHAQERGARTAAGVGEHAAEAAGAGVLETAAVAPHREAHLGGLGLDPELAEQPEEMGVGAVVADDEAAVDREHAAVGREDLVRVRVAPEAVLGLVEGDVELSLQQVGRGEPRDSRSHHCHGRTLTALLGSGVSRYFVAAPSRGLASGQMP